MPAQAGLLVALIGLNKVGVIDLQKMTLSKTLDVPKAPQEVLVRPDGCTCRVERFAVDLLWKGMAAR